MQPVAAEPLLWPERQASAAQLHARAELPGVAAASRLAPEAARLRVGLAPRDGAVAPAVPLGAPRRVVRHRVAQARQVSERQAARLALAEGWPHVAALPPALERTVRADGAGTRAAA